MTETQERFLRTVLTRVALDTVVELHLFPPIRRGTLETGVAVIVTRLPLAPLVVLPDDIPDAEPDGVTDGADDSPYADEVSSESVEMNDAVHGDVSENTRESGSENVGESDTEIVAEDITEEFDDDASAVVSAAASDDDVIAPSPEHVEVEGAAEELIEPFRAPSPRMRILTASYRHTIKGVERGKWMADVQEEADAPLEAVELVLRGVRHRSTEPADPELISLDALAALVAPVSVAPAA